jgi:hypothetical protein
LLERGGQLACVLHRGRRLAAVMLPRDGIDGVTGAHAEDSEQGFLVLFDQPIPELAPVLGQPLAHGLGLRLKLLPSLRFLDALDAAVETGHGRPDPHHAVRPRCGVEPAERQRVNHRGKSDLRIVGQPRLQRGGDT